MGHESSNAHESAAASPQPEVSGLWEGNLKDVEGLEETQPGSSDLLKIEKKLVKSRYSFSSRNGWLFKVRSVVERLNL